MASKKVKISANQALNATNKVLNSMTEISDHYVNGKKYYNSNQAKADLMVVQKLRKRTDFVAGLTVVLWLVLIIGTIVLCVTGNDIFFELLHL